MNSCKQLMHVKTEAMINGVHYEQTVHRHWTNGCF